MIWDPIKERELEDILARFSGYIRANIIRFDLPRYGLDFDDILQEVKIKIWKMLHDEKNIHCYSSYIKKIVENSVIDQFRKLKREEGIYLHEINKRISEQGDHYNPELFYGEMDLKDVIGKAVDELIESRRKVVRLYLLNMSLEEISIYFNWTQNKTRNLLYRGLSDLKIILKKKNIRYEHKP